MAEPHILLVEDEDRLARNLILNLKAEGYAVTHAGDCATATLAVNAERPIDLIILDLMLPDGDGLDLAETWRTQGRLFPILMLTARRATEQVVTGLTAGADDYLGKPFALEELLGRVTALLRRARMPAAGGNLVDFGANHCDLSSGRCTTTQGELNLTALELRLLRHFARKPGQVISREELMQEVWEIEDPDKIRTRTLDTFMGRLRKYFEDDPTKPRHFRTEHGSGYQFLPEG